MRRKLNHMANHKANKTPIHIYYKPSLFVGQGLWCVRLIA